MSQNIQVIGLGQACLDNLGKVPLFPQEDEKVELLDIRRQCGGPASTALVTLGRLGVRTSFLGSVSDDPFGIEIIEGLEKEGVDHRFLKITPGYSSQSAFIVISEASGNRTVFWHRGNVPHLKAEDVDLSPFGSAQVLHLDGLMLEASIKAARQAKDLGLKVVLDGGTMREESLELVSLVDILIASERFAEPLVGPGAPPEDGLRSLYGLGPKQVVVTLGAKGSIGWDGSEIFVQKAFPIRAVDTTGAGDVYHGAYIYGVLQGWGMGECMRFASATSALKCRAVGAREGIPNLEEIKAFMERFPELRPPGP
ncbi:MAG: PfkB family carbohydrate kinase [Desulfobacterales bacterium]|nr:PfkB family carbohydrate kinase [Desulfobacterales bacterium]